MFVNIFSEASELFDEDISISQKHATFIYPF